MREKIGRCESCKRITFVGWKREDGGYLCHHCITEITRQQMFKVQEHVLGILKTVGELLDTLVKTAGADELDD
jgi:hypothetical protein